MKQFKQSTIDALKGAGITAETAEDETRKAYFKTTATPLAKANLADLRAALNGDAAAILPEAAPKAAKEPKAKKEKAPKPPKEPKPAKVAETAEQALARLQAAPETSARWARVVRVDEMGKKGPTVVTIRCDNKGENGEDLFRTIKVQDLFQVRFSADYAKKNARKKKAKPEAATAPAAE